MTVLFDVVPFEKAAFAFSPREVLSQRCHHSKQQRSLLQVPSKITRTLGTLKTAVLEEGRKQEAGEG